MAIEAYRPRDEHGIPQSCETCRCWLFDDLQTKEIGVRVGACRHLPPVVVSKKVARQPSPLASAWCEQWDPQAIEDISVGEGER